MTPEEYAGKLVRALTSFMKGDSEPIRWHKVKYGIPIHPDPVIERLSLLKAVTASKGVPMPLRSKAKQEVLACGFTSWDDGDVPI